MIEAGSVRDDFAEATEAFGRLRTPHGGNSVVQVIRRHPLLCQFSLCADGLTTALGAMRAPEIERSVGGAQRDFAKSGTRHQLQQRFQFVSGAIDSRHYRDSHRTNAVAERRSSYLESLVDFFDSRDCGDFPRAKRYLVNRFDRTRNITDTFRTLRSGRVTQPIVERKQDCIHNRVPSRASPRRTHNLAGAYGARLKRDRASLGRDRSKAKLGDSCDPIARR